MTLEYRLDATPPSLELLRRAVGQLNGLVSRIRPEQANLPTPCPDWDLRQLVNHILFDVDVFVATTVGGQRGSPDVDRIGDDWSAACSAATASLVEAWEARGTEGVLKTSLGEFPLTWAVGQQMADLAVHTWDVARTLGEPVSALDAEVAEAALAWLSVNLKPEYRGQAFGPVVPAPVDAPAYDRLAAFSGRRVS
jgi:uncharacterized protein (TIGR03086 family)